MTKKALRVSILYISACCLAMSNTCAIEDNFTLELPEFDIPDMQESPNIPKEPVGIKVNENSSTGNNIPIPTLQSDQDISMPVPIRMNDFPPPPLEKKPINDSKSSVPIMMPDENNAPYPPQSQNIPLPNPNLYPPTQMDSNTPGTISQTENNMDNTQVIKKPNINSSENYDPMPDSIKDNINKIHTKDTSGKIVKKKTKKKKRYNYIPVKIYMTSGTVQHQGDARFLQVQNYHALLFHAINTNDLLLLKSAVKYINKHDRPSRVNGEKQPITNASGETPIAFAIRRNNKSAIRLLLAEGEQWVRDSIFAEDLHSMSALDIAKDNEEIQNILDSFLEEEK